MRRIACGFGDSQALSCAARTRGAQARPHRWRLVSGAKAKCMGRPQWPAALFVLTTLGSLRPVAHGRSLLSGWGRPCRPGQAGWTPCPCCPAVRWRDVPRSHRRGVVQGSSAAVLRVLSRLLPDSSAPAWPLGIPDRGNRAVSCSFPCVLTLLCCSSFPASGWRPGCHFCTSDRARPAFSAVPGSSCPGRRQSCRRRPPFGPGHLSKVPFGGILLLPREPCCPRRPPRPPWAPPRPVLGQTAEGPGGAESGLGRWFLHAPAPRSATSWCPSSDWAWGWPLPGCPREATGCLSASLSGVLSSWMLARPCPLSGFAGFLSDSARCFAIMEGSTPTCL